MKQLTLALVMAILLASCVPPKHTVIRVSENVSLDNSPLDCQFTSIDIVDARSGTIVIGPSRHTYEIADLRVLIEQAVANWQLNSGELPVPDDRVALSVELTRAYSTLRGSTHFFTIVLIGSVEGFESRHFRGQHSVGNWVASKEEMMVVAAGALDDALAKLHHWLEEQCTTIGETQT